MIEQYVQKLEVSPSLRARKTLFAGVIAILLSLGFVLLAAFLNLLYLIGFFALFISGVLLTQLYFNCAKQFEYDFNAKRLVISKTNMLNKQSRILQISHADVTDYRIFCDTVSESDFTACSDTQDNGVYAISFKLNGKASRLLFAPDDYLQLLLNRTLAKPNSIEGEP